MSEHASEQIELERKYDVDAATTPDFAAVASIARVEQHPPAQLEAVYYDSDDLMLAAARVIIRRRAGGTDEGWHIKKPAEHGRTELHWPLGDDTDQIPDAIRRACGVELGDRALTPLARISTRRTTTDLLTATGVAVAEFADDEVDALDVRAGIRRSWHEWEVELLPGAPASVAEREALLDELEQAVLAAGARPSTSVAKIARALGALEAR